MPQLQNPRHETFCRLIAAGWQVGKAAVKAGYATHRAGSHVRRRPDVQARIEELRQLKLDESADVLDEFDAAHAEVDAGRAPDEKWILHQLISVVFKAR